MTTRIAVVGAGLTGAAAAYHLRRLAPHAALVVFEREEAPGGRAATWRGPGGLVVDTGASLLSATSRRAFALIDALGLSHDRVALEADVQLLGGAVQGDLAALDPTTLARLRGVSWADKARLALAARRAHADARLARIEPSEAWSAFDTDSAAAWAAQTVGGAAPVLEALTVALWRLPAGATSAAIPQATLHGLLAGPLATLGRGADRLVSRALDASGAALRLGADVHTIAVQDARVEVGWADREGEHSEPFERVVLALPGPRAAALLERSPGACAAIAPELHTFIREQRWIAGAQATFAVDERALPDDLPWLMIPTRPGSGVAAIAAYSAWATDAAWSLQGRELLRVTLAGEAAAEVVEARVEDIGRRAWALAADAAAPLLPGSATLIHARAWREGTPELAPGHFGRAAAAWRAQHPPLVLATDGLTVGSVEGALAAGEQAAKIVSSAKP